MGKKRLIGIVALVIGFVGSIGFLLTRPNVLVFQPAGLIASEQRQLFILATLLMLIVVIPVFIMTGLFAWKYRESNTTANYQPDWDHNRWLEAIWWGIPLAIIVALGVIIWQSSHKLDPYRPLDDARRPVKVQVVALQWKWLFIYPDYDVATVNYLHIPEDRPINFEITADAPMNSFWIPQLGGQVYAMAGMQTKLHLIADTPGIYAGSSANISGEGFSDMKFNVIATSNSDFQQWVQSLKSQSNSLGVSEYQKLAQPTRDTSRQSYWLREDDLYNKIVMQYMSPDHMVIKDAFQKHLDSEHADISKTEPESGATY